MKLDFIKKRIKEQEEYIKLIPQMNRSEAQKKSIYDSAISVLLYFRSMQVIAEEWKMKTVEECRNCHNYVEEHEYNDAFHWCNSCYGPS